MPSEQKIIVVNRVGHAFTGYLFRFIEGDDGVHYGFSGARDRALRMDHKAAVVALALLKKHQKDPAMHYGIVPAKGMESDSDAM